MIYNVLATVSDKRVVTSTESLADIHSLQDYYPFGMTMKGRSASLQVNGGTTELAFQVDVDANPGNYQGLDRYRFGFNGMEKDDELKGADNSYDYGFRIYNPRLGRFLSEDPLTSSFPWYTPYQFAGNKPIIAIDLDGLEEFTVIHYRNLDQSRVFLTVSDADKPFQVLHYTLLNDYSKSDIQQRWQQILNNYENRGGTASPSATFGPPVSVDILVRSNTLVQGGQLYADSWVFNSNNPKAQTATASNGSTFNQTDFVDFMVPDFNRLTSIGGTLDTRIDPNNPDSKKSAGRRQHITSVATGVFNGAQTKSLRERANGSFETVVAIEVYIRAPSQEVLDIVKQDIENLESVSNSTIPVIFKESVNEDMSAVNVEFSEYVHKNVPSGSDNYSDSSSSVESNTADEDNDED